MSSEIQLRLASWEKNWPALARMLLIVPPIDWVCSAGWVSSPGLVK